MSKRPTQNKLERDAKVRRRREAKSRRYSNSLKNIKPPKGMGQAMKATYLEIYLEARKEGVEMVVLESINKYDYGKDVSKLGNKISPIVVEATLLRLAIALANNSIDPLKDVKDKDLLNALAINTLWLRLREHK